MKKELNKNNQIRCECGKLYLIKTKDGYEFKCPRCKRVHLLKYERLIVAYLTKEEGDVVVETL
jgi:phage FluMu protein Com